MSVRRPHGLRRTALLVAAAIVCAVALAQPALEPAAADALARAQRLATEALITYPAHAPDQPLWAEALAAGREAAAADPDHPAPHRFLGQAYLRVGWYARAWTAWTRYLEVGGALDGTVRAQYVEVARWMGVAAFDGGRREEALSYLQALVALEPGDLIGNDRLARFHLDRGEPLAALPYLEALDGRVPDLVAAWTEARWLDRHGAAAVAAYRAGTAALAGDADTALARFREAVRAAPAFAEAWRGVADAARRLGFAEEARAALERVLALDPDDGTARAELAALEAEAARAAEALEEEARAAEAQAEAEARAAAEAARIAAEQEAARAAAATAEAARVAAEQEAAQAAAAAAAETEESVAAEAARLAAEEEAARLAAEQEAARIAAEEEAARVAAAEQEAARIAAEQEAARIAAEQEAARIAAEQEAARLAAEQEAARIAAEEAARAAAEAEAARAAVAPLLLADAAARHGDPAAPSAAIAYVTSPAAGRDVASFVDGVVRVEVDVTAKPSSVPVRYQVCLVPPDVTVAPACSAVDLLAFQAPGRYVAEVRWSDLAGATGIDWQRGVDAVLWVLRRPDGTPVAAGDADAADYLPMDVRVRATASAGGF